mgnify:CR=1 FL=1
MGKVSNVESMQPCAADKDDRAGVSKAGGALVSVVIRSMDRPELDTALASVAAQSWSAIEVVVVEACGDGHRRLSPLCGRFPVRQVGLGRRLHRCEAANLGLEQARGAYLVFLDDDDWFMPDHVAQLVAALEANPWAIAAYDVVDCVRPVDDDNPEGGVVSPVWQPEASAPSRRWERLWRYGQPFDPVRLLVENYIPMHAALFRREAVTAHGVRFDAQLDVYEDWDFWLQLSAHAPFVYVDRPGALYRIGADSGFGVQASDQAVDAGLLRLLEKWRGRWSARQVVEIARYAKHHSMYQELRTLLDEREQALVATREALEASALREQQAWEALAREQAKVMEVAGALERQGREVDRLLLQLDQLYSSTSWRMTAPMRATTLALRDLRAQGRTLLATVRHGVGRAGELVREEGMAAMLRRGVRRGARMLRARRGSPRVTRTLARDFRPLTLPVAAAPEVSVIVTSRGQAVLLFNCLEGLARQHPQPAWECLVVRDADHRDAASERVLDEVSGVRRVAADEAGLARMRNRAVNEARGRILVFVDEAVRLEDGALRALCAVFEARPQAGAVGARLLAADGTLLEAGGVLWQDGSVQSVGRGGDPEVSEYGYVRRADCCSGALLAVDAQRFAQVAGFDGELEALRGEEQGAVQADADLALRLRAVGAEVVYQPAARAVVFAPDGGGKRSFHRPLAGEVEARRLLRQRWPAELVAQRNRWGGVDEARDRDFRQRVLVIDIVMPTPDRDSGSLRMFNLLEELVGLGHKVVFASLYLDAVEPYRGQLQQLGVEVVHPPRYVTIDGYLERHGKAFDTVMLSRVDVAAKLIDAVRALAPQARLVFDTVDLHFLREQRMAELEKDAGLRRAAEARKQVELGLMRRTDVTLVVSPYEQDLLVREAPDVRVEVVSNIHDLHGCAAGFEAREGMLFIGGFNHPPNVDAVRFFVHEVMPKVRERLGRVPFRIIGSEPPPEVLAMACDDVIVEGFVEDVSDAFGSVRLSVAPLRYGAGVKGKINMSMAYGVPVVATPIAAEGMFLSNGEDVLVAETPEDFADAIARAYRDPALWARLSAGGMANIDRHFSRAAARRTLEAVLEGGSGA